MVTVPYILFLFVFGSLVTMVSYQSVAITQVLYAFPVLRNSPKRGLLFYLGLAATLTLLWFGLFFLSGKVSY